MAVNQNVINQAKKDFADAHARGDKEGMAKAHAAAEAERAKAGYSGGADGSKNIPLNKKASGSTGSSKSSSSSKSSNSSRYNTTVYTPEGNAVSGYIQDGKTYLSDGTRIGEGYTSVDKSGRYWSIKDG